MSGTPAREALLIDRGNSRLKWAVLAPGGLGPQRAESSACWDCDTLVERVIEPAGPVRDVVVANVAGAPFERELAAALERSRRPPPRFIRTSAAACGIRNAYPDPWRLGVDRWVAMVGAWHLEQSAACVVDVGTAMTVDALDAKGIHRGGLITPGPELMVASLMSGTSDIQSFASEGAESRQFFADNTLGAIQQGAVAALAALIERSLEAASDADTGPPRLLITGGASEAVAARVRAPLTLIPDLVLIGLGVFATHAGSG